MSFFNTQPASSGNTAGNTTSAPLPNLFGGQPGAKPPGTGLFGASTTAAPSSGGLFGSNTSGTTAAPTSGGLFGNNASAAPAGGGLFGATSTAKPQSNLFGTAPAGATTSGAPTTPSAAPTSGLFGGPSTQLAASNTPSGAPGPANPAAANQAQPATLNFFSQPSNPAASAFNLPAKPADASSTAAPTNNLFGKPASAATAPASTPSPFSLGGSKDGPAPTAGGLFGKPATTSTTSTATATAPVTTFSLGGPKDGATALAPSLFGSKPEEKKDTMPTSLPTFSMGAPKEGEKSTTSLAGTSSTPIVAVAPPSMLRGKTIEEIVNKWSSELETHVREFNKFAGEVAVWDRALIENGNNLAALYSHVLAAELEQNDIDQSLDHIEQQQKELSSTLDAYEKATQEVFGGGNLRAMDTGPADTERDKNYMLATELHTQLDDLSGSLTQMIESVNSLSLPSGPDVSGDDPMAQIAHILGSHLESLQWIDGAVREIDGKVTEVEKKVKDSGYSPGSNNGIKRGYGL
ncbi:Nsp1-like C-terminal region-domain-containing protein [Mycena pura]|uniref:Nucleoporin NSP1 n=1 Tax=Mycena pura TaxID=153505 RepID=A0AAD6YTC1_9AGAR|nr:Nsp1-like C-terminal region-domain-containing protein [Mycena pura]